MKKPLIAFTPRWQWVEGMAVVATKKFYPSLCAEHEFEDLLQEAYLVYMKCKSKYTVVDNQKWFLQLFMTSLRNRLIDLVNKCSYHHLVFQEISREDEPVTVYDEGYLARVLKELPTKTKLLIRNMCWSDDPYTRNSSEAKLRQKYPSMTEKTNRQS